MGGRKTVGGDADTRIRLGALRTLTNALLVLLSLAVILGWAGTGLYWLDLGEAAIILRWGAHDRTVVREGWNWHWPEPIEYDTPVNVRGLRTEEFGLPSGSEGEGEQKFVNFIQTADSNIVNVSFELQYTVADAYSFVYGMANPRRILYEATQSSVRQAIGSKSVDEVLFRNRGEIEREAEAVLEKTLEEYFVRSGARPAFEIEKINLQTVHPPEPVRGAFDDVVAAQQDEARALSEAKGDAREILERAGAESAELRESAEAYKQTLIYRARGEASRFEALLGQYRLAPAVTRRRLYIETMEAILPGVEKIVIEPGTVNVMPLLSTKGVLQTGVATPREAAQ